MKLPPPILKLFTVTRYTLVKNFLIDKKKITEKLSKKI